MDTQCHYNMNIHEGDEIQDQDQATSMEDRTLPLLHDSMIDQEIHEAKVKKKGGRRHKAQWLRRPMAVSDVILEFYEDGLRENAMRCLGNHLNERRKLEPEKYSKAGFFAFHGCGIMAILLQEVLSAYEKMCTGNMNIRASKRLSNVLTLFQCIAANVETRGKFVEAHIPNYLLPFILFENTEEYFENVRAISLSVIGIVVQAGEIEVIRWALKNNIINVCLSAMDIGSELSKVIAMHIMESILRSSLGITHVCEPPSSILGKLVEMYKQTILVLVREEEFSPRLLFHVIRCCILLCKHCRALELLKENLPPPLLDDTFHEITKEFPVIKQLQNQLLLNLGKLEDIQVMDKPKMDHKIAQRNSKSISLSHGLNPLSPVNMNKENWSSPASPNLIVTYVGKEN